MNTNCTAQAEWNRYQKVCQAENVALPKKPALLQKLDDIHNLINKNWTPQEIQQSLDRRHELASRFNGTDRARLESELKLAQARGNTALVEEIQDKLDKLETPRLAFRTSLTASSRKPDSVPQGLSQQERLAQLNAENRRKNTEAVRRAQLKERAKAREIEKRLERGEEVEEDTSRRLKTRAKFVHEHDDMGSGANTPSKNRSGANTPANGTPTLKATTADKKQPVLPHLAKLQQQKAVGKNGLPTIHKPLMDDEIIAALDLDIDETILD